MNKHVKDFLLRGLIFGGFGPIILGIVYFILSLSLPSFNLNGSEVFVGILSTYVLAFLQAGVSVFNQIESWPLAKSLFFHFGILYLAYILCYLINSWIPFEWAIVGIFTAIFAVTYFVIWITVYLVVSKTSKALNNKIKTC